MISDRWKRWPGASHGRRVGFLSSKSAGRQDGKSGCNQPATRRQQSKAHGSLDPGRRRGRLLGLLAAQAASLFVQPHHPVDAAPQLRRAQQLTSPLKVGSTVALPLPRR
jgi:hypothetical protein